MTEEVIYSYIADYACILGGRHDDEILVISYGGACM